jgi:hypothetical protein
MIVLSAELQPAHLGHSWSDGDWLKRPCGATDGRRAPDLARDGGDVGGRPMNLCERCRDAVDSAAGAGR